MSVIWNKVWSDLWHHKIRTFLAVLSIAAGVFALGAIFGMIDQLIPNLNRVHQSINSAHLTMYLADRIDEDTATRLSHIDGVKDVEPINEIAVRYRLATDEDWQPAQLVMRNDYEDQKFSLLQLKAGEWPHRDNIGVDIRAAQYLGLEFGDKVIFDLDGADRALPVSGRIRHHFMTSPDFGDNPRFFVDAQGLERFGIPKGEFNQLLVQVEPYSDKLARDMASEIKDRLGKEGVSVAVTFYNKPDEHWGSDFFVGLNLVLQSLAEVESALVAFRETHQRRQRLARAADTSAEVVRLARRQYTAGVADFLAVLDAERELQSAEDQLVQAETANLLEWVFLYRALGGGWSGSA